jgi:hypothetical protein
LSVWWTFPWIALQRSENRGIHVFGFMIAAGTLGAACFLGAAIAEGIA